MSDVIAVTGGRDYRNASDVRAFVSRAPRGTVVHVGCASGLDAIVRTACRDYGVRVVVHRADWGRLGKGAGPERNGRMLRAAIADGATTLHAWPGGRGTANCIRQARLLGLRVVGHDGQQSHDPRPAPPAAEQGALF